MMVTKHHLEEEEEAEEAAAAAHLPQESALLPQGRVDQNIL